MNSDCPERKESLSVNRVANRYSFTSALLASCLGMPSLEAYGLQASLSSFLEQEAEQKQSL